MNHASLFSGIGGFDLVSKQLGWNNVFHCEIDPFNRKVLNYHFPKSKSYSDIITTDFNKYANRIDILTGGFPCQPYSLAGKRLGKEDERHLWPEMLRAIREIQPTWVVGENVLGIVNWNGGLVFDEVQADLENEGYEVQTFILPAASVNAPHKRDRVWFVAYSNSYGLKRCDSKNEVKSSKRRFNAFSDTEQISVNTFSFGLNKEQFQNGNTKKTVSKAPQWESCRANRISGGWREFPVESPICLGNDGFSTRLDGITFSKWRSSSIKAAGNEIVPQVFMQIAKAIIQFETIKTVNKPSKSVKKRQKPSIKPSTKPSKIEN